MSISSLDAVTALAPPSRPTETPRGGDVDRAFAPALRQAYGQERPRETSAAPQSDEKPAPPETKPPTASHDERGRRSDSAATPAETAAVQDDHAELDDAPTDDTAEISDEAASAAASLAQAAKPVKEPKAAGEDAAKTRANSQAEAIPARAEGKPERGDSTAPSSGAGNEPKKGDGAAKTRSSEAPAQTKTKANQLAAKDNVSTDEKKSHPAKDAKTSNSVEVKQKAAEAPVDASAQEESQVTAAAAPESNSKIVVDAASSKVAYKDAVPDDDDAQPAAAKTERLESAKTASVQQAERVAAGVGAVVTLPGDTKDGDSAKNESSGPAPVGSANTTASAPKSAPTLDRLAARALRASESESSGSGASLDRPRFVQRVEGALRAAQQRDGKIQVRLSPPELGNLRIELAVQNGVLTAKLEAETPAARNALLDNLPALRERLAQQEIRVEKFEVDIRRDTNGNAGGGGAFDKPTGQQDSGRQEGRPRTAPTRLAAAPSPRPATTSGAVSDAGLDVRI